MEHIPKVPKKLTKAQQKKKSKLEELLEMDDVDENDDGLQELMEDVKQDLNYIKLPFPPFYHYRIDENKGALPSWQESLERNVRRWRVL